MSTPAESAGHRGLSRRGLIAGAGSLAVAAGVLGGTGQAAAAPAPPGLRPRVTVGADRLAADRFAALRGRRVAVFSNPTGLLASGDHLVDAMVAAGVPPVAVLGPEHGFRGAAQAGDPIGDSVDPRTGLPVYDAYLADQNKMADMLRRAGADTVLFDVADVGARFYTYMWSLYRVQWAAALVGARLVVADRPNPNGGDAAGPMLDPAFSTFVGLRPVAQQHGMTMGELARYYAAELLPADGVRPAAPEVIELRGWRRRMRWADTGGIWTPPSPNVPTPDTATVYPGTCLFEGTVFSEGRGTTRPFETIGAPGVTWRWRDALVAAGLPGVRFQETSFAPAFGAKHLNKTCGGVLLQVTDPYRFDAVRTGVTMLVTARATHPQQFGWRPDLFIDKLSGSGRLRTMIDAGAGVEEIIASWRDELAAFDARRRPHLIYR